MFGLDLDAAGGQGDGGGRVCVLGVCLGLVFEAAAAGELRRRLDPAAVAAVFLRELGQAEESL